MKRRLVQGLALLLMVGALYGQGSQSTSQPAGGQHSHDQMQMPSTQGQTTDQNAPPAVLLQDFAASAFRESAGSVPAPKPGPVCTLEQLQQSAVEPNPTLKQAQ